ncbi:unnamed protein product [Didymodactylos carnosus]|uniref:Uncharacterized protein n=1 Tax=Didymodactylos carnosus TaxID=1234261 RepID=A0A8S2EBJ3_9BILA|nr:unnamed protein product [Didymodactylos carnosus]CAF3992412.1 unnamed protein product [Didymodactylos carnosus]
MVGHIIHYIRAPLAEHVEQTLHFTDHFPYISSNTVSFFHCFLSLISIKFLSNNLLTHRQVGVILFLIRNFLDCLDGVVYRAHLKNKRYKSYYGSFGYYVDALSDIIGGTCLILSCLFYFFKNPPFCTSNITLLSRLPSLSRTTRTVSSTSTSSEANGTDTILVLTNNDPKLDIYPENDDYQTITNIRHSPLSSPTLSLTNHLNNLSSRSSTLLSTTTVVQQTQSQLVPLGLQSVVESKETIFLTVLAFALRYSLSAIFWDRSLRWYEYLLDSPASTVTQQALQLSILHSPLTIVIMFLWRYLCALSIQDYLLLAIFINRTWEFLIKTNQIGWFAIILTIIFTELHINEVYPLHS